MWTIEEKGFLPLQRCRNSGAAAKKPSSSAASREQTLRGECVSALRSGGKRRRLFCLQIWEPDSRAKIFSSLVTCLVSSPPLPFCQTDTERSSTVHPVKMPFLSSPFLPPSPFSKFTFFVLGPKRVKKGEKLSPFFPTAIFDLTDQTNFLSLSQFILPSPAIASRDRASNPRPPPKKNHDQKSVADSIASNKPTLLIRRTRAAAGNE